MTPTSESSALAEATTHRPSCRPADFRKEKVNRATRLLSQRKLCAEEPVHTNLLNDEVSAHWLQPLDRGSSPGSSDKGVHILQTLEKVRVHLESHCPRLHDVVHVDDGCSLAASFGHKQRTFATTFWDLAYKCAPESAYAPPSLSTSFCIS